MEILSNPLLLIKPKGITSFSAINELKKILPKKTKIGHAGTLDPMATGLLIVLIGREQTKLQSDFLTLDKKYIAEITFGVSSNTYDIDSNSVLSYSTNFKDLRNLKLEDITKVLEDNFKGEINQIVPAYSAVKVRGNKMYQYARKGESVSLPVKKVNIYNFKIISFENNYSQQTDDLSLLPKLTIEFVVSKGTYIRSIANDLGGLLGVGGVLSGLERTAIGKYNVKDAINIEKAKELLVTKFT
ncbi:MAG: tRNA pseudouridine(55) synthase TruB [bacterium]|nr:tRNA pseudouridine(55) synthase TruB [bacterium]